MKKLTRKKIGAFTLSLAVIGLLLAPMFVVNAQDGRQMFGADEEYLGGIGLSSQDVRITIVNIIRAILGFLGVAALIIILIGGVEWMTAGGSEDKVSNAQKRIMQGVVGLAIIFIAYALILFIFQTVFNATQNPSEY